MREDIQLKAGLRFKSKTFASTAEIVRIDEKADTVIVRMNADEGDAYEREWPWLATKEHFKQGFYFIPKPILNDVTVW